MFLSNIHKDATDICSELMQHGMYYTMFIYPTRELMETEGFSIFFNSFVEPDAVISELSVFHKFVGDIVSNYRDTNVSTIKNIITGYEILFDEEHSFSSDLKEFDVTEEYLIYFNDRILKLKSICVEANYNFHFHTILSSKNICIGSDKTEREIETGLKVVVAIKPPSRKNEFLDRDSILVKYRKGFLFSALSLMISRKVDGNDNPFIKAVNQNVIFENMMLR